MAEKQYELRTEYDMPYQRSTQAINAHFRGHILSEAYNASPYSSKRETPVPELETKAGPPRKRVPVACDRCRKRKIKCSGDQGDGSGCDNCKTVGWTECQFLRVRSSELHIPHPQIAPTRHYNYRLDHRYHPYGGSSRHQNYMTPNIHYSPQAHASYPQWSAFENTGMAAAAAATVAWNGSTCVNAYNGIDAGASQAYSALSPAYMLSDVDSHERSAICMTPLVRSQQHNNHLWLDNIQTTTLPPQISCVYPLTPAESIKSFYGLPGQHALSNERSLPVPEPPVVIPLSSHGQDTPPLSAASHRSSNPWDGSVGSSISSRTSCGGNQDLSGSLENNSVPVTCEEQAVMYPYVCESAGPQILMPATILPLTSEQVEAEATPNTNQTMLPDSGQMVIGDRSSRDSLGTGSNDHYSTLYSQSCQERRSSSRRAHPMLSSLFTKGISPHGSISYSPTSSSRHSSSAQQSQSVGEAGIYEVSEQDSATTY